MEVFHEFERIVATSLWPGFEPGTIAIEVFDGRDTYLLHHSRPPAGFEPLPAAPGLLVFRGRHESVRANTGTELNGLPTATADISRDGSPPREAASLLVHEAFHVYARQAHPKWAANEAELFLYPLEDGRLLQERRVETANLVEALGARQDAGAACAARRALSARQRRFERMPEGARAYERGTELNEGLAQYVEDKSIGKPPQLRADDFPLEQIRQRGYATGEALALLLDRFAPGWQSDISDGSLDQALQRALSPEGHCPASPDGLDAKGVAEAQREVEQLAAARSTRKQDFLQAPGWRLEIVAGKEPLWPQGFDPWNVASLGGKEVLHTRWVKLGNGSGTVEVLNHASLTEGVGPHPLFNGAARLIITGLAEPTIAASGGSTTVDADGVKATFHAEVVRDGRTMVLRLP